MNLNPMFGDPELQGAACAGHSPLFDDVIEKETDTRRDYRHRAALRLCQTCTVLRHCQNVFDQLPKGQQVGVWAGQLRTTSRRTTTGAPGSTETRRAA